MSLKFELIKPSGELIELTAPYRLLEMPGIGMPPVQHRTERGPYQDGESHLGTVLLPRVVTFRMALTEVSQLALWERRAVLLQLMAGLADGFGLLATLPDGAERRLLLRYNGGLDMAINAQHGTEYQPIAWQGIAHNPLWYDPDAELWGYALEAGLGAWAFPLGFPEGFGAAAIDVEETKQYLGTWRTYPVITVVGPINNLVIENTTTNEKLDFTGYNLAAATTLTINLGYGYKTAKLGDGTDVIDELTTDSDIATWHLAAHPEAVDGFNTLIITGAAADPDTQISIQFFNRYIGI